jgi:hypothetical protein
MTDILKGDPTLIEFMLDPTKYAEGRLLAHNHYGPMITKRYSVVLDFDCNDSALVGEKVPTSSGFFVWLTTRSVLSMWRFSVIPNGATSSNFPTGNGLFFYAPFGAVTLTFRETPVPYSTFQGANGRYPQQVPPSSLLNDFTWVRSTSGMISLQVDSVAAYADPNSATGGASSTFNAFCAAGNFTNVWDILQTPIGGNEFGLYRCVNPEDVAQFSFPEDDGMYNVPASDGVAAIVACDVPAQLQPSDPDSCDNYAPGNEQSITGTGFYSSTTGIITNNVEDVMYEAWVTPWPGCVYSRQGVPYILGTQPQNIVHEQGMDITGVLDIDVAVICFNSQGSLLYQVQANHVFVACLSSGALVYETFSETVSLNAGALGATSSNIMHFTLRPSAFHKGVPFASPGNGNAPYVLPTITTQLSNPGAPTGFMYLGSQVIVIQINTGNPASQLVFGLSSVVVTTRARSFYANGSLGPARILSYYGLSNGSSVNFRATVHAEGTPTGTILPDVRRGKGATSYFSAREDLGKWARLFNQNGTPWHRCYNFRKYNVDGRMAPTPDELEKYDRMGIRVPILLNQDDDLNVVNNDNKGALIRTSVSLDITDKMVKKLAGKRGREAEEKQTYRPAEGVLNPYTGLPEVTSAAPTWNPYAPPEMKRQREEVPVAPAMETQTYEPVLKLPQNPTPSVISAPYTYSPEASQWNPYK